MTAEQHAAWASLATAAGLTVSGYAKSLLFPEDPPPRRSRRPPPNAAELSRLLAAIGSIGANINRCTFLANCGSWPESQRLQAACDDVQWIRQHLMLALGMTSDPPKGHTEP